MVVRAHPDSFKSTFLSSVQMDKRQRRDEGEMKLTLTLPSRVEAGVRQVSSLLSWMNLFDPKEDTLIVSC